MKISEQIKIICVGFLHWVAENGYECLDRSNVYWSRDIKNDVYLKERENHTPDDLYLKYVKEGGGIDDLSSPKKILRDEDYEIIFQFNENVDTCILTGLELTELVRCYCAIKHKYSSYIPLREGGAILNEKRFDEFLKSKM